MCDLYAGKVISEKVDVWALGVLLYLLTFRKHAFPDGNNIAIMGGNYTFPARKSDTNFAGHTRPQHLLDLIDYILKQDPDVRPSVLDVITRIDSIAAAGGSSSVKRAPAPVLASTSSAAAAAPHDDFFSSVSSVSRPKAPASDDFFSQASSSSGGSGDAFFAAATAPASASADFSSADFFSSPSAAKQESSTPKASASKSSSSVGSSSGSGSVKSAPAKATASAGPDLLDFGSSSVTPKNDSLDDLLSAVGGAPPPSFVSPFQSSGAGSLADDLFAAAPSHGMGMGNAGSVGSSMGLMNAMQGMGGGAQPQAAMGQFGGMGAKQGMQVWCVFIYFIVLC